MFRLATSRSGHSARARSRVRRNARPHHRTWRRTRVGVALMSRPHDSTAPEHTGGATDTDINFTAIVGFGIGLIVTGVLVHLVVWLLFAYFNGREAARVAPAYPLAIGQSDRQPPEPRLQVNPREDLRALRAHEDDVLSNYAWIDRQAGVLRIPIEEAIRITAQRGLPSRAAAGERK